MSKRTKDEPSLEVQREQLRTIDDGKLIDAVATIIRAQEDAINLDELGGRLVDQALICNHLRSRGYEIRRHASTTHILDDGTVIKQISH